MHFSAQTAGIIYMALNSLSMLHLFYVSIIEAATLTVGLTDASASVTNRRETSRNQIHCFPANANAAWKKIRQAGRGCPSRPFVGGYAFGRRDRDGDELPDRPPCMYVSCMLRTA